LDSVSNAMDWYLRVNFGRCAIIMVAVTCPFWGDFWPPFRGRDPLWGQFERLYCSNGPPYLFKFWSIWDKYNGRLTQISICGGILLLLTTLNFRKTLCGVVCLMDPLPLCRISSLCDKLCRRNTSLSSTYEYRITGMQAIAAVYYTVEVLSSRGMGGYTLWSLYKFYLVPQSWN